MRPLQGKSEKDFGLSAHFLCHCSPSWYAAATRSILKLKKPIQIRNSGFVFEANFAITQQSTLLGLLQRNTTALLTGDSGCSPLILSVQFDGCPESVYLQEETQEKTSC